MAESWGKRATKRLTKGTATVDEILKQLDLDAAIYEQWRRRDKHAVNVGQFLSTQRKQEIAAIRPRLLPEGSSLQSASRRRIVEDPLAPADRQRLLRTRLRSRYAALRNARAVRDKLQQENIELFKLISQSEAAQADRAHNHLNLYNKFGKGIAMLSTHADQDVEEAEEQLRSLRAQVDTDLGLVQSQVRQVDDEIATLQKLFQTLDTYKDREYPSKLVEIRELKDKIEKAKREAKREERDVQHVLESYVNNITQRYKDDLKEVYDRAIKKYGNMVHPSLKFMAAQNVQFADECQLLQSRIATMQDEVASMEGRLRQMSDDPKLNARMMMFPQFFPRPPADADPDHLEIDIPRMVERCF